jgi:hypothetical protein
VTDRDYGFRELWLPDRAGELRAACFYELVRESRPIMTECEWWLRFEKPRAELFQKAEDQGIDEEALRRAFVLVIQDEKFVLSRRRRAGPAGSKEVIPMEQNVDRARKLLSGLSDDYREVVVSEYQIEKIERYGDEKIAAPRLRLVAEHLVKDTPWLKIPKADRGNAIATNPREFIFRRTVPAIEIVEELGKLVRLKKALSGMFLGEIDIELPRIRVRCDRSDRALRECWAQLGERLVINRRPKEWKHKAKVTAKGRRRPETWCQVVLQELAALRLAHVLPPKDAHEKFCKLYAKSIDARDFRGLRISFIERFQRFFDTDRKPRHVETLAARLK